MRISSGGIRKKLAAAATDFPLSFMNVLGTSNRRSLSAKVIRAICPKNLASVDSVAPARRANSAIKKAPALWRVFPAVFSLLQFGEVTPFLIVLIAVGCIQVIVGNIIEPKLFGKSLNLSPLVTILSLAVWGKIWGITGMVLSVPITVIMIIIFSQFEKTKSVAILLSENGDIEEI